jgi:hypothetical protein
VRASTWLAVCVCFRGIASAQPAAPTATPDGAPPPGGESGRIDSPSGGESPTQKMGNVVLAVPRAIFDITMLPVRTAIVVDSRYRVARRIHDFFFTGDGRIGVYPIVSYESTQGWFAGPTLLIRYTDRQHLKLFAGAGVESRRRAVATFRSVAHLDGRLDFGARLELDQRPRSRFYGLGNGDEIEPTMSEALAMDPIDAIDDDTAVLSYYRNRLTRAAAIADVTMIGPLHVGFSGAVSDRERRAARVGPAIDEVYTPESLVAFDDYRMGYGELELRLDTRGPRTPWVATELSVGGSLLSVYGGAATLKPGPGFWRYGLNAQQFIPLGDGPRVLLARVHGEGVTAKRDGIPFTELPMLGGGDLLRGYQFDRFRDRVAAIGSLEYQWGLSRNLYASLFVDAGRVYEGLDALTFEDLRCGYGVSLEGHTDHALLVRVSLASSIDGGAFMNFYLDPITEIPPRVRRR